MYASLYVCTLCVCHTVIRVQLVDHMMISIAEALNDLVTWVQGTDTAQAGNPTPCPLLQ